MSQILVTSYESPDLDGTACAIAYAEFLNKTGKKAEAAIYGQPTVEARYVLDFLKMSVPRQSRPFNQIILTDASILSEVPKEINRSLITEIVDHRKFNELENFPNAKNSLIELVGAAATLISEKYINSDIKISSESAILLHQAIISNTINFKAKVTTKRDKKAAEYLKKQTKISDDLTHNMFAAKSDMSGKKLSDNIKNDISKQFIGGHSYIIGQLEIVGTEKIVNTRKNEVLDVIKEIKQENNFDKSFISLVDLEENHNTFLCSEPDTQKELEKSLGIKFVDNIATRPGLIMRKEIIPLLKDNL